MSQVAGSVCVWCEQMIRGLDQGKQCTGCGHAVHHRCIRSQATLGGGGRCHTCGVALSDAERVAQQDWHERLAGTRSRRSQSVSRLCPRCGNASYLGRRPQTLIAFTWDRVGNAGGTRYTPPTPAWAAMVFLLVGLPLAILGLYGCNFAVAHGNWVSLLPTAFFGFLGLLACIQGVRILVRAGEA